VVVTKFYVWGWVVHVIIDAKFLENQQSGFRVTGPPPLPPHLAFPVLSGMFITLTTVSAVRCYTVVGNHKVV